MVYNILLVEDDIQLAEIIVDYFHQKSQGTILLHTAFNGQEALDKWAEQEYDLALLDIMLPKVDGFTLCKELRKNSDIPIIFITAKHDERDRLYGYNLGCDDYVAKPFSLAELYAKVMALIKRAKGMIRNEKITVGSISLNPYRYTVYVEEKEITLTPTQFTILKILMENQGCLVTRESLIIRIWGYDFAGNERVVDNHIKKLRQALGEGAKHIKTIFRQGYKLEG